MDTCCRRCGRWTWSEATATVNISSASASQNSSRAQELRDLHPSGNTSAPHPLNGSILHLPQLSATWTVGTEAAVYSFGGSSSADASKISNERRDSGEQCTVQAIGISDELWYFSSGNWRLVKRTEEGEQKLPRLWPRARYASTSWSVGDGHGQGLFFSGEFEYCSKRDYLGGSGTPPETTDMFLAPDSLFLFTPASHERPAEWTLLGGRDSWNRVPLLDLATALQQGYLSQTYPCGMPGDELRECAWPLPRAYSQGWTLSGKVYMFSGLYTTVDQSFQEARRRSSMLNDLWQISILPASNGEKQHMSIARVAACATVIDKPGVVPNIDYGGAHNKRDYPGPRFSAATWNVPASLGSLSARATDTDSGWLFGGVGRLISDLLGGDLVPEGGWPDGPRSVCNTDEITAGYGAVRNLCDLWVFVPGDGFRLVQACNVDVPWARSFMSADFSVVSKSVAPTAGIFATTWVGELSSLWMFGGLTGCSRFDGIGPDGAIIPEWEQSRNESWGSLLQNMTMCDLAMRGPPPTANTSGSNEWLYPLAAFPGSHIDQPCTADMWRFSLVSETWVRVAPDTSVHSTSSETGNPALWPHPRCGAAVLPSPSTRKDVVQTSLADGGSGDSVHGFGQFFVGGWGGSSSGECEEWPSISNTDALNSTVSTEHCDGSSGVEACPVFKGFLSADVPSQPASTQRTFVAQCRPMTEVWLLGLVEVP